MIHNMIRKMSSAVRSPFFTFNFSFILLAGLLTGCDDPFEGDTFVTPTDIEEEMTCTSILESRSNDFSMWLELLKYADYYNGLKDADATATVFAPTNKAMTEFLQWRGVSSIEELDKTYAQYVVQTHIINGLKLNSETFINYAVAGEAIGTQSLFQAYLRPSFGYINTDVDDVDRTDEVLESSTIFLNNQAAVQPRDSGGINFIQASNAMIYYMDDVIHPLAETMVDRLEQLGDYSIFAAAARECGYDEVVSKLRDTIRIPGGGYSVKTYNFTCFAPTDDAMKDAGINSLADLKAKIGSEDNALWNYVSYHFFDQSYTREKFFSFDTPDQILIYDTNLSGQVVTCENTLAEDGETVMETRINQTAHVLRSNIEARNGYIHKIDYWMPVWAPEPVTVRWDFCNTAEIISFVNGYGADKGLGELFSNSMTNREYQIDLAYNEGTSSYRDGQYGEITESTFTYKANPTKASTSNYRKVGFKKCKYVSTRDKENNAYGAYMNNLLVLNLGYAGWIQFNTPTIIAGKYKVVLHYASEATMRSFHAAGSLTKFQVDPELGNDEWTTNKYVFRGLPTTGFTYGSGDLTLFDEMEFETSGTHVFRATILDINAKTNGSYHQLWDYLEFIPVNE